MTFPIFDGRGGKVLYVCKACGAHYEKWLYYDQGMGAHETTTWAKHECEPCFYTDLYNRLHALGLLKAYLPARKN